MLCIIPKYGYHVHKYIHPHYMSPDVCLPTELRPMEYASSFLQRIAQKELGRLQKERSKDQSKIKQLETESKQREIVLKVCWAMRLFFSRFLSK